LKQLMFMLKITITLGLGNRPPSIKHLIFKKKRILWVCKNKYKSEGSLDKHKARLVAKGYAQNIGIDYDDTFSPTTKWATIHALLALDAHNSWDPF
jgi:hypothetical protein